MKQKNFFFLSITALLLFTQCSNNVSDTIYNNDTSDCNCGDKDAICDPCLVFPTLESYSPSPKLSIHIPRLDGIPQHEDWDTIIFICHERCELDTNCKDKIKIASLPDPITRGDIVGKNKNGSFKSKFISNDNNDSIAAFINKISDHIRPLMLKTQYYISDTNGMCYFEEYWKAGIMYIPFRCILVPEKKY